VAADPDIDYSAFDNDGDGFVDADELAIVIIAAGYECAYSPKPGDCMWGWRSGISSAPVLDGVTIGSYHGGGGGYAMFGEKQNTHQATMGIMVHELGHLIFGFPDLYNTNGGSNGIGGFGVMGGGSWGTADSDSYLGETPVFPCAWTRAMKGWVDGTESTGAVSLTAAGSASADSTNSAYKILTDSVSEYFLVENRYPVGYDTGLQLWLGTVFGGLAIWHIDESKYNYTNNSQECAPPSDCSSTHYMVSLEQADGNWHLENDNNSGNKSDLWYTGNVDAFDYLSTPDSDLYDGTLSEVSATNISAAGEAMTADLTSEFTTIYEEDFESGTLGPEWTNNNTNNGRTRIITTYSSNSGRYHAVMDDSTFSGTRNELILTIDLSGQTDVKLKFFQKEFYDNDNVMPDTFTGSHNSDGVAVSSDGTTWYKVQGLTDADGIDWDYRLFSVDLDAAIASAGISYNSTFQIKFQHYGNAPLCNGTLCFYDGFAFDDIQLAAAVSSCVDTDEDGYGSPGDASCPNGAQTDCNDGDGAINPGAAEIPADGTDQDCDTNELCYDDTDNDNYVEGGSNTVVSADLDCLDTGEHTATTTADYDDTDGNIYPGGPPVRVNSASPTYHQTIQDAYDAASDTEKVQVQTGTYTEDLAIDMPKSVIVEGGYSVLFTPDSYTTTLEGNVNVSDGIVSFENFVIEQ
jgi:M6 family metalloprotease-like protein